MSCIEIIYIGNTAIIELQDLTNAVTELPETSATVTTTLYDAAGVEVSGQTWPLSMSHVSAGTYRATLDHDLVLTANRQYVAHVDAGISGVIGHWELPVRAKVRT
jgi:hypothetical protein